MSSLAVLRERPFRLLWLGQGVSALGDALMPVGLAVAVLEISGSTAALGAVLAVAAVARLVLLPLAGVWADRRPPQTSMIAADVVRAAINLVVGALLVTRSAELWQLLLGAAAHGAAEALFQPTSTSVVPATVGRERLQAANALMGTTRSLAQIVGPVVSGLVVGGFGPGWLFLGNAASFAASGLSLALLPVRPSPHEPAGFLSELANGWREMAGRRWYWLNLVSHACCNLGIAAFFVLGPAVAVSRLGGPRALGLILAAASGGALLGGLAALFVRPRRPLVAANLVLVPACLPLLALSPPGPTAVVMTASAAGFACQAFTGQVWQTTIQQLLPVSSLAKISAYDWLISSAALPAGYGLAGSAAAAIGLPPVLLAAAGILVVPSLLVALHPDVRAIRRTADGIVAAGDR